MANKFYGLVGYAHTVETTAGVWELVFTERNYTGYVTKNFKRLKEGESTNDDLSLSNTISILSDPYADENFFAIKYVEWMGVRWSVTNIEVQRPRLILTLGGVYNGKSPGPSDNAGRASGN